MSLVGDEMHAKSTNRAEDFWNVPLASLWKEVGGSRDGLGVDEAATRLKLFGKNTAADVHRQPLWLQFLLRFRNPLIILLLAASVLSAATGDQTSFLIIIVMVILSVILDFYQETRAEKSVDVLKASVAVRADVLRGGAQISILAQDVVPGDVIQLSAGSLIPADGRLIESKDVYVNQALLTGESFPAEKHAGDLLMSVDDITEASNAVFMGTSVISGGGTMVAVSTGKTTRLGQLAGTLARHHPPTAFEQGVQSFGMLILRIAIVMVLFVLLVNMLFHRPMLESFLFALALAVGLTPELLPMIMTITLARGATRMAKQKVIVKHLPAMHNLGAMDVLCTDKTGTLTEAAISLVKTLNTDWQESEHVLTLAYVNSYFESGVKTPLDQAILDHGVRDMGAWRKLDEVPFDFERRRISVLATSGEKSVLVVKGAPEDILKLTTHYEDASGAILPFTEAKGRECKAKFDALSEEGFRVLGIAYRDVDTTHTTAMVTDETELTFAGFAVFIDPPKLDAAETLRVLARDGIQVKIISGDNEHVTSHVCTLLGFDIGTIITGAELAQMSDEALLARIDDCHVFCRVTPQQKSRIIAMLKVKKHVVGFMGDGINDASALHVADVGISVDSATDVAKEAADIILMEHNLSVIHNGVIEGRRAVINTEKYILMGSSSNFGNMFSMAGAALFLSFLPMLPIQILLNNLLYDFSQTILPFDNVDKESLQKPVHWNLQYIKRYMGVLGPASSVFDFLTFYVMLHVLHANESFFQTGWFVESIVSQVLIIFAIRTRKSMFHSKPYRGIVVMALGIALVSMLLPFIPIVATWFHFIPLPPLFFVFLACAVVTYFLLVESIKAMFRREV
jgi:Mg2+-importing ATPase